jgi:hypothetical protein
MPPACPNAWLRYSRRICLLGELAAEGSYERVEIQGPAASRKLGAFGDPAHDHLGRPGRLLGLDLWLRGKEARGKAERDEPSGVGVNQVEVTWQPSSSLRASVGGPFPVGGEPAHARR